MDISALQRRLRTFAAARDWQPFHTPKNLAMALMVEAGELLELFQWLTTTESRGFTRTPQNKERVADEIADVLLYLLQLADHVEVDVEQAVEHKLRKNAEKHPAKRPEPPPPPSVAVAHKLHLLVDWENVQPTGEALRRLMPEGTDVWIFHGPQQKVDAGSQQQVFGADRVTLVPRSGVGRNALDFQLSYYVGYISARQADSAFVVISNDHGYDPMLEHARELGFDARRCAYRKTPKATAPKQPYPVGESKGKPSQGECVASQESVGQIVPTVGPPLEAVEQAVERVWSNLRTMPIERRPRQEMAVRNYMLLFIAADAADKEDMASAMARSLRDRGALLLPQEIAEITHQRQPETSSEKTAVTGSVKVPGTPSKKKVQVKARSAAPVSAKAVAKKAAPAKKTGVSASAKAIKAAIPDQIAQHVLASLRKMSDKRPKNRTSLLRHIATHVPVSQDRATVAKQVCALMQSKGQVQVSVEGERVAYPGMA